MKPVEIAGWIVAVALVAAPFVPRFGQRKPHDFHPKPHEIEELQQLPAEEYSLWLGKQRRRSKLGPGSQMMIVVVPPASQPLVAATAQDDEYDTESAGGFPLPWPKVAEKIAAAPTQPLPVVTHGPQGDYHHHVVPLTGEVPTYLLVSRFEPPRSWWGVRSASLIAGVALAFYLLYQRVTRAK
jgi:hypothetical protein